MTDPQYWEAESSETVCIVECQTCGGREYLETDDMLEWCSLIEFVNAIGRLIGSVGSSALARHRRDGCDGILMPILVRTGANESYTPAGETLPKFMASLQHMVETTKAPEWRTVMRIPLDD